MSPPLDLGALRIFSEVAVRRSFSGAAGALGTSQSRVSQAVAGLERQLGHRLFERTTRQVRLTASGKALRIYAEAMGKMEEDVRRHFEGEGSEGELRLGVVEDFAMAGLHRVLALFARQHPRFSVTVRSGLSTPLRRLLDQGELHLALTKRLPGQEHARPLGSRALVWVGQAVLAAGPGPLPLVTYPEPSETRTAMIAALRRSGRSWRVVAESDGITGQRAALEAGLGLAAFSEGMLPDGVTPLSAGLPALGRLAYGMDLGPVPHPTGLDAFVAILGAIALELLPPSVS